jgi:4-diphosphocytidyl-2-C-methyl-D-erythritol kinase
MPVHELAPAKVNLTLAVRGRRADGYHELESVVTFADVHDVVTLDPGTEIRVAATGPFAGRIGGANLLDRALALLREAEGRLQLGSVLLEKNLPVAAGLGGGSADAAALLRAVRRANPDYADRVAWAGIAARLGADVPVCLSARPALMWGIGEKTAALTGLAQAHAVLVNPGVPVPTTDVFRALGAGPAPAALAPAPPPELRYLGELARYMRSHGNDLEPAAVRLLPAIAGIRAALEAEPECLAASMSGSGPTCFGIFAGRAAARRAADRIAASHGGWWVRPTVLQGVPAA